MYAAVDAEILYIYMAEHRHFFQDTTQSVL